MLISISAVALHQARLLLDVCWQVNHLGM